MTKDSWQRVVDRSQHDLVPIIASCLPGVLLLSLIRDLFGSSEPSQAIISYYALCFLMQGGIWLMRQLNYLPLHWSQAAGAVCVFCILINPTVEVFTSITVGPLYLAVALFGSALTVLSLGWLVTVQSLAIVAWFAASIMHFPFMQIMPILFMNLLAAWLGAVTLRGRLATLRRIYQLESKVKALESILPMCSGCKKTEASSGEWISVESYVESLREGLLVSHGLCPDCKQQYFGDFLERDAAA